MPETKYEKHLTRDCYSVPKEDGSQIYSTRQLPNFGGGSFSIDCTQKSKAHVMIPKPHHHAFDQYLCFFGSNPDKLKEFDAEIELCLGEEQEKHIINSPTVVHVPAGLIHGPIVFTKVNKPVLFVDIAMTNKYVRVTEPDDKVKR